MRVFSLAKIALVGALLTPYALCVAQGIGDVLNGKGRPTTIAPVDLPENFKAVRLRIAAASTDPLSGILPLMTLGMGSSSGGPNVDYIRQIDQSWTDGSVEVVEGQRFLVTYRLDMSAGDLMPDMMRVGMVMGTGSAPKPKPPLKMNLVLVKVDSIQEIAPTPDLTKERLLEILGQGKGKTVFDEAQDASSQTRTLSNMKQVGVGMMMYCADFDDMYPWPQSTKAVQYVIRPYLKNMDLWQTANPNGGEVRFNMAIGGVNMVAIEDIANTVMFYESKAWPDGRRAVAFTDGHAKMVTSSEWQKLEATLRKKFPKSAKRPLPLNYGTTGNPPGVEER